LHLSTSIATVIVVVIFAALVVVFYATLVVVIVAALVLVVALAPVIGLVLGVALFLVVASPSSSASRGGVDRKAECVGVETGDGDRDGAKGLA
jgi:hypothetical protein